MRLHIIVIICILIVLLAARFFWYFSDIPAYVNGQVLDLPVVVQSQPKIIGTSQKLTVSSRGNTFFVTTSATPAYWYAQQLHMHGTVRVSHLKDTTFVTMYYPTITSDTQQNVLAIWSHMMREKVSAVYARSLDIDARGLLIGMVFGVQQQMSAQFLSALRISGVMHVIAASGMNITFVAGGLLMIFSRLFHRKISLLLTLIGVLAYTALAGFQPSIDRAAIMGGLTLLAGVWGRQSFSLLALVFAAYSMLLFHPGWIADIGFQLSFTATAGLFFIKPFLDNLLRRYLPENILLSDLTTTTAAQIATLPILLTDFGYYNPLSIVINLLVLWTVPFIMLIGVGAGLCAFVFVPVASSLTLVAYPLLWYFRMIVMLGNSMPTVWQISGFPVSISIGYYCILIGLVLLFRERKAASEHL